MLNVTTIKFAINENVVWDIMSKFEQEFSSKKEVHHACDVYNPELKIDSYVCHGAMESLRNKLLPINVGFSLIRKSHQF